MRWGVLLAVAGCIEPALLPCGDQTCPHGQVCVANACATVEAVAACTGQDDGIECALAGLDRGVCRASVCRALECGDGFVELDEICDDGNTASGDMCNATCTSTERCGNGVVDLNEGEQCDAGEAGLSGDGCSSLCQLETGAWTEVTPQGISARAGFAMAYDSTRAVTVLFGGATGAAPLGDTWLWNGTNWLPADPLTSPPPRRGAAMAYDPTRQEMIMFGGLGDQGYLADTWRWDGLTWQQLSPATSPSARAGHAMTWYPELGNVILHGGGGAKDSWRWTGTTWEFMHDKFYPLDTPGLEHPAMVGTTSGPWLYGAYDQGGNTFIGDSTLRFFRPDSWNFASAIDSVLLASDESEVVLFGGLYGSQIPYDETWTASTGMEGWTQRSIIVHPAGRTQGGFAYDAARSNYVLFGGLGNGATLLADTWTYAAGSWTARPLPSRSPPAVPADCVYDSARGRVVLWLGEIGATWIWTARGQWQQAGGVVATPIGAGHALAYDSARGVTVLVGRTASAQLETWELQDDLSGASVWKQIVSDTIPSVIGFHAIAYDRARAQVVMFGGTPSNATWTYDGSKWTEHTVFGPPARHLGRLAYDARRERVVLFGGNAVDAPGGLLADTWEWDGTSWTERTPASSPAARFNHTLTYDPLRETVVLVGGETATGLLSDTWEWDGIAWRPAMLATSTPVRGYHCAAYDLVGHQLLLFGGKNFFGTQVADTWALRYADPTRPGERCRVASEDLDGDGLAGCADPDCLGRCAGCGDGACNSLVEDHDLCPVDCP